MKQMDDPAEEFLQTMQTDNTVYINKLDIIIQDNEKETCLLTDSAM